jgi:hypothetical protein
MASQFDLAPRLAELQAAGLTVKSEYRGNPAQWLSGALDGVDLYVLNIKGSKPNDVLCMVRLSTLEKLLTKGE